MCSRFAIKPAEGVQKELEALSDAEQTCCAFLDWHVSEDHGQCVLRVIATSDSVEELVKIAAMFGVPETTTA